MILKTKKRTKNILFVDWKYTGDWLFLDGLEQATGKSWFVRQCASNTNYGGVVQRGIRYLKFLAASFWLFLHRRNYASVLAWQQFYGLFLAFYCRVFRVKKAPSIFIMMFIYRPRQGYAGKLYYRFMRYIVTSNYVEKYVVYSQAEKKRYAELFQVPESRFEAVKLGVEDKTKTISPQSGNFYLAAGRSNRDYAFLLSAWKPEYGRLKIVCDTLTAKDTENIECLRNCHDDAYFAQLAKCRAVIISLDNTRISSGQSVVLQAMMYGKPIIVTENETISEYVIDGKDGFVIEKTAHALEAALRELEQPAIYQRISRTVRKHYEESFGEYTMGYKIGECIKEG